MVMEPYFFSIADFRALSAVNFREFVGGIEKRILMGCFDGWDQYFHTKYFGHAFST